MADAADSLELPPRKSLDDPGAHELDTSDSDDQFVDARTGNESAGPITPHTPSNPATRPTIDTTSNAQDPYGLKEAEDEESGSKSGNDNSPWPDNRSPTPGGHPIPMTVVEKVDPLSPSYGEVPGTDAYEKRKADAVPDVVSKVDDEEAEATTASRPRAPSTPGDLPIPTTRVEPADDEDATGRPRTTSAGSFSLKSPRRKSFGPTRKHSNSIRSSGHEEDGGHQNDDEDFGDDFDEFEEGEEDAEFGEFGEFDDGFQETATPLTTSLTALPTRVPSFPVLDFDTLEGSDEILAATEPHMNALFPPDEISTSKLPNPPSNPVFLTDRSASLWSQLVAPPPLQPPNWIRSRIRRLFLVSLGVPVDLDEILPASKQKKLILPSVNSRLSSSSDRPMEATGDLARLKQQEGAANASQTSVDSQGRTVPSRRRRGPAPPPDLDLVSGRQMCGITDEALTGMTTDELQKHVSQLEKLEETAQTVLEYWTKRIDEKLGDREAFEGVIENLVKHARKVRK